MKVLIVLGWVLLSLEAIFVGSLFIQRNVGDDAAGRGMATGFGIVLAPLLLATGALFLWGQRGGPRAAFWAGLAVAAAPVLLLGSSKVKDKLRSIEYRKGKAQYGRFDDPKLTAFAGAIDRGNIDEIKASLAAGSVDFSARDVRGRTILGHAVTRALDGDYGGPSRLEALRLLLAAGAKPIENAIAPERTSAEPEGHLLLATVLGGVGDNAVPVLDTLLGAGLSPDGLDSDDRPVIFSTYLTLPKLEILVRRGANLQALDTRSDRDRWNAVMNAAYMGEWVMAKFFLDHGVSPAYIAPGGVTLEAVLAERARFAGDPREEPGYAEFAKAIERR